MKEENRKKILRKFLLANREKVKDDLKHLRENSKGKDIWWYLRNMHL